MKKTKITQGRSDVAKAITEAIEIMKPIVQKIEKGVPTTKDNYGAYMAVLAQAKDHQTRLHLSAILIFAGANKNVVVAALKLS